VQFKKRTGGQQKGKKRTNQIFFLSRRDENKHQGMEILFYFLRLVFTNKFLLFGNAIKISHPCIFFTVFNLILHALSHYCVTVCRRQKVLF
jgi:hypothetical protein